MKTLSTTLAKLSGARVLAEVPAIVIRPISDHSIPTLEDKEVFTPYPVVRLETSDVATHAPLLQSLVFPVETMSHIPSARPGSTDSLTRRIRFALINAPYKGFGSLFEYLTQNAPLDRADLMLRLLTVPTNELGTHPNHQNRIDFGVSDGEVTDVFEGRVERVTAVGDTIQCEGRTVLPVVPWKLVPDSGSDVRDRGLRLPFPLGQPVAIRCVNLEVGGFATLAGRLAINQSTAVISAFHTLPTSGGTAMFGAEAITWTSIVDNTMLGLTRGKIGTVEADHILGTQIFEVDDITIGIASFPMSSVKELYIRNEGTNSTVQVSKLLYSVNYADETTAPGDAGDPITTVTLTGLELAALLQSLFADAAVTQQAVYSQEAAELITEQTDDVDFADSTLVSQGTGAFGTWANHTTVPVWTYVKGGSLQEGLTSSFPTGLSENALQGLHTARFDFEIDVTSLGAPIAIGLLATGAEGVLSGFVDGNVVATTEVVTTGLKTIHGTLFSALDGQNVGDLSDVVIALVKSEVTSQGNPAIVFEVKSVSVTYEWLDDIEEVSVTLRMDSIVNTTTDLPSPGTWESDWSINASLGGLLKQRIISAGDDKTYLLCKFTTDPTVTDELITKIEFTLDATATEDPPFARNPSVMAAEFDHGGSDWSEVFTGDEDVEHLFNSGADVISLTHSSVFSLTPGVRGSDLVDKLLTIYNYFEGAQALTHSVDAFNFEIFWNTKKSVSVPILQTGDAQIQAAAGGIGLQFFAVVDGPEAPDSSYSVVSGELITHPSDLIRYWLQEVGGFASADVDATTFAAAVTNLPDYEWGFDARNLGASWRDALLRMGFEARANIARPSGGDWKMLTANSSHSFGSAVATVSDHDTLNEIHKDDRETRSRLTVYFAHDPRFEENSNRSFVGVQTTDPTTQDVIDVEAEFGRNDAEPYFLFCHNGLNAAGVTDWRLYMEQELGRGARIFVGRVDHWDAYALEIGDVVDVVVDSGTVTCRVIEVDANRQNGFNLRFVEVL